MNNFKVLDYLPRVDSLKESAKDIALNRIAGFNFHNRSPYNFDKLNAEPDNVAVNLRNYINGVSTSAREIVEYFNFDDQIDRLDDQKADMLFRIMVFLLPYVILSSLACCVLYKTAFMKR